MKKLVLLFLFVALESGLSEADQFNSRVENAVKKEDGKLCMQVSTYVTDIKGKDVLVSQECHKLPDNFLDNMNTQKARIDEFISQYNSEKDK